MDPPAAPALGKATPTSVTQLSPSLQEQNQRYVRAVVVLLWPFSSTTKVFKLLLAEPDFRLRNSHGQILVTCRGAIAESVAKSKVGIGDTVLLGLDGASWEKMVDELPALAGKSEWSLIFTERILLEIYRESSLFATIDADFRNRQDEVKLISDASETTGLKHLLDSQDLPGISEAVASPFRLRSTSVLGYLTEEDGYIFGKGRKRTKFGRLSSEWVFVDSPPSPAEKTADWDVNDFDINLEENSKSPGHFDTEPQTLASNQGSPPDFETSATTNGTEAAPATVDVEDTGAQTGEKNVDFEQREVFSELHESFPSVKDESVEVQREESEFEVTELKHTQIESSETLGNAGERGPLPDRVQPVHKEELAKETDQEAAIRTNVPDQTDLRASHLSAGQPSGEPAAPWFLHKEGNEEGASQPSVPTPEEGIDSATPLQDWKSKSLSPSSGVRVHAAVRELLSVPTELPQSAKNNTGVVELQLVQQGQLSETTEDSRALGVQDSVPSRRLGVEDETQEPKYKDPIATVEEYTSETSGHIGNGDLPSDNMSEEMADVIETTQQTVESTQECPSVADAWSEHGSDYISESDNAEDTDVEAEYESQQSRSHSEVVCSSSSVESEYGLEEGQDSHPITTSAQSEVIVIDSDDESEAADSMLVDSQRSPPENEGVPSPFGDQNKIFGHSGDISHDEFFESNISNEGSGSLENAGREINQNKDDTRSEDASGAKHTWFDRCAEHSVVSTSSEREQLFTQLPAATERRIAPEHVTCSTSGQMLRSTDIVDTTVFPRQPQQTALEPPPESEERGRTFRFKLQENSHAGNQMITADDTQERTIPQSQAPTPLVIPTEDSPCVQPSRESHMSLFTTIDGTDIEQILDSPMKRSSENRPVSDDVDTEKLMHRSEDDGPGVVLPMATGALIEEPEEEPKLEDLVDAFSSAERSTSSPTPSFESAVELTQDIESQSEQISQLSSSVTGRRTRLAYFCPLSLMPENFNTAIDTLTVVASTSPVSQADCQPFDNYLTVNVVDPSTEGNTVCARIFCTDRTFLPVTSKGDVILLRSFKVSSVDHKLMLCSTSKESSWAVFIQGDENHVQISGPPVEYGDEERAYVSELRRWYIEEGKELVKINESSMNRGSTEISATGTSDAGSVTTPRHGKNIFRRYRRTRKATPRRLTVHELRHGRRYTDTSSSDKESIHKLRDGTLYAHF
ncbi:hypothetical protein VTO42DRAFT_6786 [Malbranchea cinnamomea]